MLRGLLHFIVADAGGANANSLGRTSYDRTNFLQVDIPAPVGNIVGVADFVPEYRATAT